MLQNPLARAEKSQLFRPELKCSREGGTGRPMGLGFQFTAFWEATRAIAMYLIILISTQSYIPA